MTDRNTTSTKNNPSKVINPGRFTAHTDQPFVVFLIGMRVNQFWAFDKWTPVAQAMAPMLKTLYKYPEKGFLGGENFFRLFPLTTLLLSYWRSFDDLEHFARSPSEPHLKAWQSFNKSVGNDGSVGIWHETYRIEPGNYEVIYGNMPVFGLAAATQHLPIGVKRERASERLEPFPTKL
ncbi:MAG: DUF4188 domain-containing protein [Pseudanabaenaceae cyanobacterium bins.68]|nr:DUF4188 domain-containing protein [Pseudanabaenaceae cyanobacterium bins.68]